MKQIGRRYFSLSLMLLVLFASMLSSCGGIAVPDVTTVPAVSDTAVITSGVPQDSGTVTIDFYSLNDIHGNVNGNERGVGISKTATFLRSEILKRENTVLLSTGDAWQGSSESNNTRGALVTEWMNSLGFAAMTLGNHEFDWTDEAIVENSKLAQFPMLAINVYETATNTRAAYCKPSVMIERSGVKIGIIGAIGDVYSSISASMVKGIGFITGSELTKLVKAEAEKLRADGADIVVYALHDGSAENSYLYEGSKPTSLSAAKTASYYDASLSNGYIDLVFEGHTHASNVYTDPYGVYHLQAGGYNQGLSHVSIAYDFGAGKSSVKTAELIFTTSFSALGTDTATTALLEKYAAQIGDVNAVIGYNEAYRDSGALRQLVADLYLATGTERWKADYDIFLAGGYMSCRSPGYLAAGEVCYADIQTLFPFDNKLVICSVSGASLLNNFINTSNRNYFVSYSEYGSKNKNNIDLTKTYYIISDTYSSDYAPNKLTVLETYSDSGFFARDLLAEYIRAGGYGKKSY